MTFGRAPARRGILAALFFAAHVVQAATTILFVAGEPSHGPGEHRFPDGCALLAEALNASGLPVDFPCART
jgi:hypothetical protein